jgi:hypothetical protein
MRNETREAFEHERDDLRKYSPWYMEEIQVERATDRVWIWMRKMWTMKISFAHPESDLPLFVTLENLCPFLLDVD